MEVEPPQKIEIKATRYIYDQQTGKMSSKKHKGLITLASHEDQKIFSYTNLDTNMEEINLVLCPGDARFSVLRSFIVLQFETFEDKYFFALLDKQQNVNDMVNQLQKTVEYIPEQESAQQMQVQEPKPQQNSNEKSQLKNQSLEQTNPPKVESNINTNPSHTTPSQVTFDQSFIEKMQQQLLNKKGHQTSVQRMHLSEVLSNEFIKFAQENQSQQLLEMLPQDQKSKQDFRDNLYSAQFQQAIQTLDDALNSENGISLFYQMRLDTNLLNNYYGTEAFLKALEKWGRQQKKQ